MDNKEIFNQIVQENITRPGIDKLMGYLESSDFYTAPCSARFHLNRTGGLLEHSINVYNILQKVNEEFKLGFSAETIAICGLFHDLCKTDYYKTDAYGKWIIKDDFPCGHGEKSVIMLINFIRLTKDEILAIRWHMSGFDTAVKGGDFGLNNSQSMSKLVGALQIADLAAANLVEV